MSLSKKFRTCSIIFLLLISSISIFIIPEKAVAEEDPLGYSDLLEEFKLLLEFFPEIFHPHPYRFLAEYYYTGEEPLEIDGDMVFDLYFSSTILTQSEFLDYRDSINVSVYTVPYDESFDGLGFEAEKLENANATLTLAPELFGETIQKCSVTLEGVNHTLNDGDSLIFSIEIMQSQKPIGKFFEKRYERKIKARLEKLALRMNQSDDPEIASIGDFIKLMLDAVEDLGISGEEVADLINTLRSSSLVYGSETYPSSVFIPINSDENLTLYFNNSIGFNDPLALGQVKILTESISSNTSYSMWPPIESNTDGGFEESEMMNWFIIWLLYVAEGIDGFDLDENKINYYLISENKLDASGPEAEKISYKLTDSPTIFEGPDLSRNKIIKNVRADLYLYYPKILSLGKVSVTATLLDGDETIEGCSVEMELNRTKILELLQGGPNEPTSFVFDVPEDYEIEYDHNLNLQVSVTKKPLLSLRKTRLVCGVEYPSNLFVEFAETTHTNMTLEGSEKDQYVVPGGSAEYILNITSKYSDIISLDVLTQEYGNDTDSKWNIEHPESVEIEADGYALVHIFVSSTDPTIDADGDKIYLTFVSTGKTGIDSKEGSVEVSDKGIEYDTVITVEPLKQETKHGESAVYYFTFKNNNTGVWPDNYRVIVASEHDWEFDKEEWTFDLVNVGDEVKVNVTLHIPAYTDITSDKLTFTVISRSEQFTTTMNVTTTVTAPNALEQFYHFFELLAEKIGLDEVLGDYAAPFLIFIAAFLIFIILIILLYVFKKKYVEIICLERIKDINPDEEAKFELTIRNPTKNEKTYEINIESEPTSEGLDVSLEMDTVVVASKESKVISLTVSPNDNVKADDWMEVKVTANVAGKKKSAKISTVTTIKDAKKDLRIYGVFHWPRVFKKGDRVETSFKLENKGNVSANNVTVVLLVNGKEKNKVEGITIPRGGYADIEIPWIAVKGKNDVDIVVK